MMSKVEAAVRQLKRDQVERVAAYLKYPPELFYEDGPLHQGKSACLYHRKRKTLPATLLTRLDATMVIRLINTRRLLNGLELETDRTFHTLDPDEYNGPEDVARVLRTAWGVADGPIRNLVALLESAGGIILTTPFGTHKLFGMSQWPTREHPLFFLNAESAMEDLRWTMAHELGHLIMHGTPTSGDIEEEADEFAGEFLAPRRLLLPELRGLTFARLPALKMKWGIPMKALIKRADVLGAVPKSHTVRLYKQYSARRWHNDEPYPLPREEPTLVRDAARVHLEEHEYSVTELARAVRLLDDEFRDALLGAHDPAQGLSLVRD
jgi:Zn-dependent peptidase ImmA (M78 family)